MAEAVEDGTLYYYEDEPAILLPIDGSSGSPELEKEMALVFQKYLALWKTKQRKYGPSNISAAGLSGLYWRMNDKMKRLQRFIFEGLKGDGEGSFEDAFQDLMGYAAIGLVVLDGKWPACPKDEITLKQVMYILELYLSQKQEASIADGTNLPTEIG